ncbi:unnamed protein product [Dicrocoelium dendriticum]|nr:unnamed protein product [Dicrocoelium dendriticum]
MSVLTQAEVDCLLTEMDPYVNTEEEREALGLKAFTKYFAEIPGFGERFCTEEEKDLNVVLHSDAVKNIARQAGPISDRVCRSTCNYVFEKETILSKLLPFHCNLH